MQHLRATPVTCLATWLLLSLAGANAASGQDIGYFANKLLERGLAGQGFMRTQSPIQRKLAKHRRARLRQNIHRPMPLKGCTSAIVSVLGALLMPDTSVAHTINFRLSLGEKKSRNKEGNVLSNLFCTPLMELQRT